MPGSVNPPVNPQSASQGNPMTPTPAPGTSEMPSPPPGDAASYPFAQAATGFQCPESQGFTCFIRFNVPDKAASPGPSASASASPSPSPTSSTEPDASASPPDDAAVSPSPASTGPNVTLALRALPQKDVPSMIDRDPKAVATTPLIALRVTTDADVILEGKASAEFTLPKEQVGGRGFAIQLFHETRTKKKTSFNFFGSYDKSKIKDQTLRFEFTVPKLGVKKGEAWLFVLYGDELPEKSPLPSPSASASATASASASASPSPSPSASASPAH
jgi:hypothetical protein